MGILPLLSHHKLPQIAKEFFNIFKPLIVITYQS